MSAAHRINPGFHQLGLFFAVVTLLVGLTWAVSLSLNALNNKIARHEQLLCAHGRLAILNRKMPATSDPEVKVDIEGLGTLVVSEDFLNLPKDEQNKKVNDMLGLIQANVVGPWKRWVPSEPLSLSVLGCGSRWPDDVSYAEILEPPEFRRFSTFANAFAPLLAVALGLSLTVYVLFER